jgi:hypothetical protein
MIDWEKPIAWSTGEPANISGDWGSRGPVNYEVTACKEWVDATGDQYVFVAAEHGCILGCEHEYPHIVNQLPAEPQAELA